MKTFLCLSSRFKKDVLSQESCCCWGQVLQQVSVYTSCRYRNEWKAGMTRQGTFPYEEYTCERETEIHFFPLLLQQQRRLRKTDGEAEAFTTEATGGERGFFSCSSSSLRRKKWTKKEKKEEKEGRGRLWSLLKYLDSRLQRNLRREREFGILPDCLFPPGLEWESSLDCDEKRRERSQSRTRAPSSPFSSHHLWFLSCLSFSWMHFRRQNNLSSQSWCPGWTGIRQECSVSWTLILFSLLPPLFFFFLSSSSSSECLTWRSEGHEWPLVSSEQWCLSPVLVSFHFSYQLRRLSLHFLSSFITSISIKNFRWSLEDPLAFSMFRVQLHVSYQMIFSCIRSCFFSQKRSLIFLENRKAVEGGCLVSWSSLW